MSFADRIKAKKAAEAAGQTPAPLVEAAPDKKPSEVAQEKPITSKLVGFGFKKQTTPAPKEEPVEVLIEEVAEKPLPKVIQAYNQIGGQAQATEGELLSGHEAPEAVKIIQQKIEDLSFADNNTDLKHEMAKLSEMLIANPAACLFLLDEDLGKAVRALRRMTDNRVAIDMAAARPNKGAKTGSAAKPITADEMADALDAL